MDVTPIPGSSSGAVVPGATLSGDITRAGPEHNEIAEPWRTGGAA
ncbi:hypothetical protein [Streptomyces sp. NPDC003032]